jgi:bud site selection protein 20
MPAGKSKKTGNGSGRHKIQKRKSRARFGARHIDQVFEDYMKPPGEVLDGKHGPVGTSGRCDLHRAASGLQASYLKTVSSMPKTSS